jgi:ABC-type sugar transport system ATPase subunit
VLFGDRDVTDLPTAARNIAQVFQFPVVYDTMSVYDNLASTAAPTAPMWTGACARWPR